MFLVFFLWTLVCRWDAYDKGLARCIPRGFIGSFTPRPFRPALAEYAVRAAREDPKFWGLGWTQLPDTRCAAASRRLDEVALLGPNRRVEARGERGANVPPRGLAVGCMWPFLQCVVCTQSTFESFCIDELALHG